MNKCENQKIAALQFIAFEEEKLNLLGLVTVGQVSI